MILLIQSTLKEIATLVTIHFGTPVLSPYYENPSEGFHNKKTSANVT